MGAYQVWLTSVLAKILADLVDQRGLGRILLEMLFDFARRLPRQRRPDLAFVSYDRWPRDREISDDAAWKVVPDLAVEIVSPTNTANGIVEKMEEYFQVGVRQVWVIYDRQFKFYVYDSPKTLRIFGLGDELDGGDVLPGIRFSIQEVFDRAGKRG